MQLTARDARGVTLEYSTPPQRIVSLVPSTTETLVDLGVMNRIVGVTRFCVHPQPWVRAQPKIGGTKDVDIQRVLDLKPDLVVGNCEENTREIFDALSPHVPVYAAFPKTVDQALADLTQLAALIGQPEVGNQWVQRITEQRRQTHAARRPYRYAYVIWKNPWMTVSDDTFIASMLAESGGQNVFGAHIDRFPTVTQEDICARTPDTVLLSSEPFPFQAKHQTEWTSAGRYSSLIDGEFCSWHGTRMARGFAYLTERLLADGQASLTAPRIA